MYGNAHTLQKCKIMFNFLITWSGLRTQKQIQKSDLYQ